MEVFDFTREGFTQPLAQVDRAVLTACASDSNGHVAAIAGLVTRQPALQIVMDVLQHLQDIRLGTQKISHFLIKATQRAQFSIPLRIRQASGIKYHIGVYRYAVFEAKRLKHDRQR